MDWFNISRRGFVKMLGTAAVGPFLPLSSMALGQRNGNRKIHAHLWMYASQFPPDWDSTPILDRIFSDFKYAGLDGIEIMDANLRNEGIVPKLRRLIGEYGIPVIGASFYGDMWNSSMHGHIRKDAQKIIRNLSLVGASHLGITVGDAGRKKTEPELDDQAMILREVIKICHDNGIDPNLHNHTFEMQYDQVDFLGTLERVPEINLGPDVNWLIRSGIDPVKFIHDYGSKITFIHLRDQDEKGLWTDSLGTGSTDFHGISRALKKVGYNGDFTIELSYERQPTHDLKEDLKKSREYVKNVFL
ncbi:sugar phosphate isomerase/epimerase family protein [Indibacter alkaliphilus]|uniref:sugar phosphate isomerase/epimerase family protein n=1 Tax=Indibacter alkaliphilus TaxID=579922 RepID=UPI00028228D0|nr:TIM barrel protein [Indibacter alkaliphilus]